MKRSVFVLCAAIVSGAQAQTASTAVKSFSELGARTEAGISFDDYVRHLGATNHALKEFIEGPEAAKYPAVKTNLGRALERYSAAALVWQAGASSGANAIHSVDAARAIVTKYPAAGRPIEQGGAAMPGGGLRVSYLLPFYWQEASAYVSSAKSALSSSK